MGAHRVQEVGPQGSVFYASVLETELCAECPRFCAKTAFELVLTIAHTAKLVLVRDVGRKNVGSRPSGGERMGEPSRDLLLLLDGNYWEPYGRSRPRWPGKQKAQELTQRHQGDLESLFLAAHKLMEEMLPEAEFSEACENLLETQVMGQTPDGQLGQWILRDAVVHSLEGGHQWTLVPLRSPSKSRLKASYLFLSWVKPVEVCVNSQPLVLGNPRDPISPATFVFWELSRLVEPPLLQIPTGVYSLHFGKTVSPGFPRLFQNGKAIGAACGLPAAVFWVGQEEKAPLCLYLGILGDLPW